MGLGFEGNDSNSQSSTDFKGGKIQKVKKAISESDLECRLIENGILKNAEKRVIKYPPGGFFFLMDLIFFDSKKKKFGKWKWTKEKKILSK